MFVFNSNGREQNQGAKTQTEEWMSENAELGETTPLYSNRNKVIYLITKCQLAYAVGEVHQQVERRWRGCAGRVSVKVSTQAG